MKQINTKSRQLTSNYNNNLGNNIKLNRDIDSLDKYSLEKDPWKNESQNSIIKYTNMNINLMNLTNINKSIFNKSSKNQKEKNSTLIDVNRTGILNSIIPNKNNKQNPTVLKSSFIAGALFQNKLNKQNIPTNQNNEIFSRKNEELISNEIEGQIERKFFFPIDSVNKIRQNFGNVGAINKKNITNNINNYNENFYNNNITKKLKNSKSGNKISESLNIKSNNYEISQNEKIILSNKSEDKEGIFKTKNIYFFIRKFRK
jgi:hypothetical protein